MITSYKTRKLRILVANDDKFQLLLIKNALDTIPYVEIVFTAQNGLTALNEVIRNEAIKAYGNRRFFDLIFLDLNMPIMDGYEACTEIIKHYSEINNTLIQNVRQKEAKMTWLTDLH